MSDELPGNVLFLPEDVEALQSRAAEDLRDDLRRGWHAKAVIAGVNQARMAKAFQQLELVHNEALGQLIGVVEPWVYYEMMRKYGRECWRSPEFRRDFFKQNPEAAIRSKGKKTVLRVDGLRKPQSGKASAGARTNPGGVILC